MASMKEIALGVTSVLRAEHTPDPLFIDLWNEPPSEAAALIRAVLAECHDANIGLKMVRMPKDIWDELATDEWSMLRPPETSLVWSAELDGRLEFCRQAD